MYRMLLLSVVATVVFVAAGSVGADPLYVMRVDGNGVPLNLSATGGFSGGLDDGEKIGVITRDDDSSKHVVVVMDRDGSASGFDQYVLDPDLAAANNAPSDGKLVVFQTYANQELYAGSVLGGVQTSSSLVIAGHARATSINTFFGLSGNGGTFTLSEYQLRDGADGFDVDGGFAALLTNQSVSIDTGNFKRALALVGESGGTFSLLLGSSPSGDINRIRKMDVGAYTIAPTATTPGTRSVTSGGTLRDNGDSTDDFMPNLVSGINDDVRDFAINPGDGYLYFLSDDRTNGRVFLSAVSFSYGNLGDNSPTTIVDLDPDTGNTYLELTYVASANGNDVTGADLVAARGLAFSPDGSVLYVTNGSGDGSSNRVFIFDLAVPVPEPATVALLALGGVAMLVGVRRRRPA